MAVAAAAFSIVGGVLGFIGQSKQAKAMEKAEKLRQRQMELEAQRRRRDAIRQSIVQRAQVVGAAAGAGVATGDSSVQAGGGSALAQGARQVAAINQDEGIGIGISKQNQNFIQGGQLASIGQGISSLGGALTSAGPTLARIGGFQIPTTQNLFGGSDNRAFTPA